MDEDQANEQRQLQHAPAASGRACTRCGVAYGRRTAYLPCFVEGDSLRTWATRNAAQLVAARGHVPELLVELAEDPSPPDVEVRDGFFVVPARKAH